ncbi:MAG: NTP transferase domain-containing protein [Chloroflexota bacterium]
MTQSTPENIVVPMVDGQRSNPTVFGRRWFPELARCSGDTGGRTVIAAHPEALVLVETDADLRDVDTPEDLAALS